ncbi:MAG: hypothetical protein GY860_04170 [Desulfobacteraceae bacterium]|nr:hypothetical protein [Desulfobacteraceae bacterium]
MKKFIIKALVCFGVFSLTFGCATGKRFKALVPSEPGTKFDSKELTEYVENQNEVYEQLKSLAGFENTDPSSAEDWQRFIRAGISYADDKCEVYMGSIFDLNRARNATTNQITLLGAATAGVLAAAEVAAKEVAITAIAFGLAGSSVDNLTNSFLYDLEPSGVRSLVEGLQTLYVSEMNAEVNDRTVAFDYIRGYACICVPASIEAEINNAVKTAKADAASGSSTSAPKVSVNPQVINIKNSASRTQAIEATRIENIYTRIDDLTGNKAMALAKNMPFMDDASIVLLVQTFDPKDLKSKDGDKAKQLLKRIVSLTGKSQEDIDKWEAALRKVE